MIKKSAPALILLAVLTACAGQDEPVDPCAVNPTYTNILGQCVEADGEPCDQDPCDADDDTEVGHDIDKPKPKKTTAPAKPKPKRK